MITDRHRELYELTAEFRTPFYVFDLDGIRSATLGMMSAWRRNFPHFTLAYSFKTNCLPAITTLMRTIGAAAEVVSGPELEIALEEGFEPDRIYFDGPVKSRAELELALRHRVRIQIDSLDEVATLTDLAPRCGVGPVSVRLAVPRGRRRRSRFGLLPEEFPVARKLLTESGFQVSGVHFNTGVHPMDAKPYRSVLRAWRSEIESLFATGSPVPVVIDIGGGFPAQSCTAGEPVPAWNVFADGVLDECRALGWPVDGLHLVIEPGRSLVEDHALLVSSVVVRKSRNRRELLVLDCGTNAVRSISSWFHPVEIMRPGSATYDIYGSMCYESDLFARGVRGPSDILIGDRVVVGAAGGYDIPSANVWLRPSPPVYGISEGEPVYLRDEGVAIR
ncbi:hypothetical protein [Nocardia vaccinii]|uniref:hypothetical protein n=1 Tax=Nocardia vaccinii TaxID=1822 RepID=UPI00082FBF78|nr:hypothetical protein [Nocardia vaccinii]